MNITIVSGSHRKVSQSIKIAKAIKSALKPLKECDEVNIFEIIHGLLERRYEKGWKSFKVFT